MVIRVSDKTQNYSKVTKLLVKPLNLSKKNRHDYSKGMKSIIAYFVSEYTDSNLNKP